MSSEWRTSIPLFVLSLDIFSRVILHHRRGDQGQDHADENVDSDRIGGVIFCEQASGTPDGDALSTAGADPPKRLKPADRAAWREMQEHRFWLTSADQFMVEIAASLMAKHRGGTIDNPARSLLVSTLSKLGLALPNDPG